MCVRDTCAEFMNGLGASVIGFNLTTYVRGAYKPDLIPLFIPCGSITLSIFISGDVVTRETSDRVI